MVLEILAPLALELGEGARCLHGRLYFVDLLKGMLYEWRDDAARVVLRSDQPIGAASEIAGDVRHLVLAEGLGLTVVDLDDPVRRALIAGPLGPSATHGTHRVNDAAVDPAGSLWVGTMPMSDGAPGAVYRLRADRAVELVLDGIACPNGPAFGADGSFFLADTVARTILRGLVRDDGAISGFSTFVDVAEGLPDGMMVDTEGCVWVALWGAGRIHRYDPTGRLRETWPLGAVQPTSVCVADVGGTPSLVVTSARTGLGEPGEGDGAVWAMPTSVEQCPTFAWQGAVA